MGSTSRRYPPELKERAVRLVLETIEEQGGDDFGVITRIAHQLDIGPESLRKWVRREQIDAGSRPGTTTSDNVKIRELERDNRELRRSNAILRSASAFFAAELDRPQR
jgi:transposase